MMGISEQARAEAKAHLQREDLVRALARKLKPQNFYDIEQYARWANRRVGTNEFRELRVQAMRHAEDVLAVVEAAGWAASLNPEPSTDLRDALIETIRNAPVSGHVVVRFEDAADAILSRFHLTPKEPS